MPFTFVRPADPRILAPRPLLDLGTGDGQTLKGLGLLPGRDVVGVDGSESALRLARRLGWSELICGRAEAVPFRDEVFAVVLAADLIHHAPEAALLGIFGEMRRVLSPAGRLIAWWYASPGRGGTGAPRYPRPFAVVADAARDAGLRVSELELSVELPGGPPTVGLCAARSSSG